LTRIRASAANRSGAPSRCVRRSQRELPPIEPPCPADAPPAEPLAPVEPVELSPIEPVPVAFVPGRWRGVIDAVGELVEELELVVPLDDPLAPPDPALVPAPPEEPLPKEPPLIPPPPAPPAPPPTPPPPACANTGAAAINTVPIVYSKNLFMNSSFGRSRSLRLRTPGR
jgi:hypothetical protein